ncbi:MAG TPA: hypothetical protein VFF64_25470 [Candidatus Eremiobacteraceae bacterium]|nr:hypothetical protein [Candidatus Eremiobacteraceae bacterium]
MTDQTNPSPPRRRGRPCKEQPWLKEVAQMVGRGTPLRRALWSRNVLFTERELKNIYRLKKFREYFETAKIEFYWEWGKVPERSHTSPGERLLAARLNASQLADWLRSR